jgi:spore coat protein H
MTDALKLDDKGKPLDPEAFDASITIMNGKDTYKLIDMINAINSANTDDEFMAVFNKYFDRNNYLTWLAINIVSGNKDTTTQNFFLLNPKYSDKFYFAPWDYDGAARDKYKYAKWELGISNWWDVPLHRKFIKIKQNRDDINKMVRYLREKYMSDEIIHQKMDSYRPIVEPFLQTSPDGDVLPYELWLEEFDKLRNQRISDILDWYFAEEGVPMSFWQSVEYVNGTLTIKWDESIDFEGDEIIYDLKVSPVSDLNMTNPIIYEKAISKDDPRIIYEDWGNFIYNKKIDLAPGNYYLKVVSYEKNNPAHYQVAFDKEVEVNDVGYHGYLEFKIE